MLLYFEFDQRRAKAEVTWPKQGGTIIVHLTDARMVKEFPADLYFEVDKKNKVVFTIESRDNKKLIELQNVLAKRLQEFVNKS
jgi:hypothetical protein